MSRIKRIAPAVLLAAFAVLIMLPLAMILTGSFMGSGEVNAHIGMVTGGTRGSATWPLVPQYPTLRPYIRLLLDSPQFFVMFWNSCLQAGASAALQLVIAVPAAWAFGRMHFRGSRLLFSLYLVLMVLPFQTTMVSTYLALNRLSLLDTHLAVILPNVFQVFPVYIMTKFFRAIPESLIEAARIDGAGSLKIFIRVGLPMGLPGILASLILNFLDYWNAVEQPLTFLKDKSLWPMSLYLSGITAENLGVSFGASVVAMLPPLLLFFAGQKFLEEGIASSGIKG